MNSAICLRQTLQISRLAPFRPSPETNTHQLAQPKATTWAILLNCANWDYHLRGHLVDRAGERGSTQSRIKPIALGVANSMRTRKTLPGGPLDAAGSRANCSRLPTTSKLTQALPRAALTSDRVSVPLLAAKPRMSENRITILTHLPREGYRKSYSTRSPYHCVADATLARTPPTNSATEGTRTRHPMLDPDEARDAAALPRGATPRPRRPAVMSSRADDASAMRLRRAADSRSSRARARLLDTSTSAGDEVGARRGVFTATGASTAAALAARGMTAVLA